MNNKNLPSKWIKTTLGEVFTWMSGGTPTRSTPSYYGGNIPWVTITDLNDGLVINTHNHLTDIAIENSSAKLIPANSVMIGLYGSIGKLGIAGRELTTNQAIASAIPNFKEFNSKFLFYYLAYSKQNLAKLGSGVTQKNIYISNLKEYEFHLPPFQEQKRITDKIDELFSELDNGIEELETAQKKLELYRQSLLKSAVEGELSKEWRETQIEISETGEQLLARILKERRERWDQEKLKEFAEKGKNPPKNWQEKYPEPVQPDTENLPQLPEGWVWASLDMLLQNIKAGKSFRCEERPPKEDEIGVVKVSAVSWGEYKEMESKTCLDATKINSDYYIKENDFLMSRANTIQLVGACVISRDVNLTNMLSDKILRLDFIIESLIFKNWILHLMRSKIGREQIEASATGNQESMKNISQDSIKKITVPLPPTDEIKFLIKELSEKFNAIQDTSNLLSMNFNNLAQQRKNILKDAFTGKLVPQNESDEPASILLERIRAEREVQAANVKKKPRKKDQKSNLELIVPKTDEDKLKVVMDAISSFGNQTFSAQDLSNKCMLNYDDFSDILFNLLSEDDPVIEQIFDTNIKAMRLKKI